MAKGKDQKPHIGIFGRTNTGKSSLINVLTQQDLAIVSDQPGTTTDPVKKSMEIKEIGGVVLIDTAGTEDTSNLGQQRLKKTISVIQKIDLAILVIGEEGIAEAENWLISKFDDEALPFIVVYNKSDVVPIKEWIISDLVNKGYPWLSFSCRQPVMLGNLISVIQQNLPSEILESSSLIGDLIKGGDTVVLVTPIDDEAPEGRLILPQVQLIRDILDNDAIAVVLKERELDVWMQTRSGDPAIVITDSQAFPKVSGSVPDHIPLSSFSIVLARRKGNFDAYIHGTRQISKLQEGDRILILESCTHQVSCDDIGRIKIPRWLNNFTGIRLNYTIVSGNDDLPEDLDSFAMVVQCGGCVMTARQVAVRIRKAIKAGIPVSNYGMCISYVHGIFNRAVKPFGYEVDNYLEYL